MISLLFHKSTSKKYPEALKHASGFSGCEIEDGINMSLPIKEVFEKWESFNKLFWIVVDWKGTFLTIDGMEYHSHTDKTRIFYSLQLSHSKWINFVEMKTSKFFHKGEFNDSINIDEKDADYLIDLYSIKKDAPEVF